MFTVPMGALARYNINTNLLQTTKGWVQVDKLPHLTYFCQTMILPSLSIGEVPQNTPNSIVYRAGDLLTFDMLSITFLVDEELRLWEESYKWMAGLSFPESTEQYRQLKVNNDSIYSDITVGVMDNSQKTYMRLKFTKAFIHSIGPINLTMVSDANEVLVSDISFRFDTMQIERVDS